MSRPPVGVALLTALTVTSYISFVLVAVNVGFGATFLVVWLRSWAIAVLLATPSLRYVAPVIRKLLTH